MTCLYPHVARKARPVIRGSCFERRTSFARFSRSRSHRFLACTGGRPLHYLFFATPNILLTRLANARRNMSAGRAQSLTLFPRLNLRGVVDGLRSKVRKVRDVKDEHPSVADSEIPSMPVRRSTPRLTSYSIITAWERGVLERWAEEVEHWYPFLAPQDVHVIKGNKDKLYLQNLDRFGSFR